MWALVPIAFFGSLSGNFTLYQKLRFFAGVLAMTFCLRTKIFLKSGRSLIACALVVGARRRLSFMR
ncbi:hypothetical protein Gorai_002788 [Gossypium raimondii]|uniref:Uncharacterized protein n=1 Tax=Gossypium raimondii TaxID=29730 RepID=A0A7J8QMN9_GOSRA|nr:hypothetical protein [Gossypium raimondii]